jgi:hypothetical protein
VDDAPRWFRAKTVGWGWGLPLTWQGWVAYAAYAILLGAGVRRFPPDRELGMFMLVIFGLTTALIVLCAFKGEKPGSRSR